MALFPVSATWSSAAARGEPVARPWRSSRRTSALRVGRLERLENDELVVQKLLVRVEQERLAARHPGAEIAAVAPSTTTVPRVMYSHAWSPTPSTTAVAPELRTAKRSPAAPAQKSSPPVAP